MLQIKKILLLPILCMIFLAGCKNERVNNLTENYQSIVNNQTKADDLITKSVDIAECDRLKLPYRLQGSFSLALNMNSVKDTLGLECLRVNGKSVYSVHKFSNDNGEEGYCFISYESEVVIDSWFVIKIPSRSDFKKIKKKETTLEQIKQLDPATIVFDADEPISYHRFADGTMMEVRYQNNGVTTIVKDYGISKDPANIVKSLLPIDLMLVK